MGFGLPPRPGVAEDAPIVVTLTVDYEKSVARGCLRPSVDPGRKQLHFRMDTAARSPRSAPQGTAVALRAPSTEPHQRASPSTLRPRSLLFRPSAWVLVLARHRLRPTVRSSPAPTVGTVRAESPRRHARSLVKVRASRTATNYAFSIPQNLLPRFPDLIRGVHVRLPKIITGFPRYHTRRPEYGR